MAKSREEHSAKKPHAKNRDKALAKETAGAHRSPQKPGAWSPESIPHAPWILAALTCACLLPFLGEAFHIDDTLFLFAAKQIAQHPLDPYGFSIVWYSDSMPMSEVTKNPPLASYYLAAVGSWAGWSERVLHMEFLLAAVVTILAVYHLARDLTRSPLLAACASLAAPGFLVSATSVMCDIPMLALWLLAVISWRKGLREEKQQWLALSGVLIGVCALTKYFGASLIPLLLLYSLWQKRRLGRWSLFLLIPVAMLVGYQVWTASLYDHGLLSELTSYVSYTRSDNPASTSGTLIVALSFVGGCTLPALAFVPWMWSRRWVLVAAAVAILATLAMVFGWVRAENSFPDQGRWLLGLQLWLFILGGISALWLAVSDFWQRRDADSVLLAAWVLGTFAFAAFFNWTVNGRSVLPMIPAVAVLIARRLDDSQTALSLRGMLIPLTACLAIGLWIAAGDAALSNSARTAAHEIQQRGVRSSRRVLFAGHWGFQYYMEAYGGQALDSSQTDPTILDLIVRPDNNTNPIQVESGVPVDKLVIPLKTGVTTMRPKNGAGFYSSTWGPMPYVFGPVPDERYDLFAPGQSPPNTDIP